MRAGRSVHVRSVQEYARVNPGASTEHLSALAAHGRERGLAYLVAAYSGLRRGEILALRWSDVVLGSAPAIVVRPEIAKNRKAARLELPAWVGARIEAFRSERAVATRSTPAPGSAVFGLS